MGFIGWLKSLSVPVLNKLILGLVVIGVVVTAIVVPIAVTSNNQTTPSIMTLASETTSPTAATTNLQQSIQRLLQRREFFNVNWRTQYSIYYNTF